MTTRSSSLWKKGFNDIFYMSACYFKEIPYFKDASNSRLYTSKFVFLVGFSQFDTGVGMSHVHRG